MFIISENNINNINNNNDNITFSEKETEICIAYFNLETLKKVSNYNEIIIYETRYLF